ncbi:N-acetylmuramoyl-L-alanine amidase [Cellulosilyticum sp. I15G10I2]|uniref:N-acetylmuramoyl-L-alanine amidase n=1 Tax=Cellulosilyticum sp. I15G10I2 TaxID=1892843 RepID=UPI00085BECA1|nr:N-acetylmuramoyl-L-alanine amidase [Cellulosilyticum sp. I15G10I2]
MKNGKMPVLIILLVTIISIASYLKYAGQAVETLGLATSSKVIIIDPGHGGFDPGKNGINGEDEKHINLKIALKLRNYFEQSGAVVIMTRTTDDDADGMDGVKHKRKDMAERKKIAQGGDILISIHQNSFTQPSVKGAQVFYNKNSEKGKLLADLIQKNIKEYADPENKRKIKSNNDYYVLKVADMPAVIVECGFLTNPEEEKKLNTDEYQNTMAWSIYVAVVKYFEGIEHVS